MKQGLHDGMEIMGHKTHVMAMRYQHPAPDHKLEAVKRLDNLQNSKMGDIRVVK